MICEKCNNGFLTPSFPIPFVLSYRGFQKIVYAEVFLECNTCCHQAGKVLNKEIDTDVEMSRFKYEINKKLSGEEL